MMKYRLYFDKDEETKWLNQMAEEGWALERFFAGFYRFEECEPGQYTYQVDFGDRLFSVSDEYKEFMQDTGVEIMQTWGYWIFLRKLSSEGEFELYTDVESSIEHYRKIRRMFKVVAVVELIALVFELFAGMEGVYFGYACAFLIGAMLFAIVGALMKTNDIIAELQERKGEVVSKRYGRYVSPLLPCGLLLNSCAIIIEESVSRPVKWTVQVAAILLMLAGVYLTGKNKKE